MTPNLPIHQFIRSCLLVLPVLLSLSGFQSALAQSQLTNLSTRARLTAPSAGSPSDSADAGFKITGTGSGSKLVLFRALGPSLAIPVSGIGPPPPFVPVLADPRLTLTGCGSCTTTSNDDWISPIPNGVAILTPPAPNLPNPPPVLKESAFFATMPSGSYTARMEGKLSTTPLGFALVELYDSDRPTGKLVNLSTRAFVGTGDAIVIAGFILEGTGSEKIVLRGLGPSLIAFGITVVLPDPTLELRDVFGNLLMSNDNWQDNPAQAAELTARGLAPTNNLESGIVASLLPGNYTVLLAGKSNATGNGTVEVYDVGP